METKTVTAQELRQGAAGFNGTEVWYKGIYGVIYTEGVKWVADTAGAYWLIDEIDIANKLDLQLKKEEFQVWKLTKDVVGNGAALIVEDGNGHKVYRKEIGFTDFPLEPGASFDLWCTDNVILLPSEY
jgi:hypothetical protein